MRRVAVVPGDFKRSIISLFVSCFFAPIFSLIAAENRIPTVDSLSIILALAAGSALIAWNHRLDNVIALWTTTVSFFFIITFLKLVVNLDFIAVPLSMATMAGYYYSIIPKVQWQVIICIICICMLVAYDKFTGYSLALLLLFYFVGLYVTPVCQSLLIDIAEPLSRITQFRIGQLISFPFSIFATSIYFTILFKLSIHFNLGSYEVIRSQMDINSLADWLFFSSYLILTGNLIGITPTNFLAKAIVMSAVVTGIFWLIIYLGLVMSSFQLKPVGGDK